jgi:hypothetical protein
LGSNRENESARMVYLVKVIAADPVQVTGKEWFHENLP